MFSQVGRMSGDRGRGGLARPALVALVIALLGINAAFAAVPATAAPAAVPAAVPALQAAAPAGTAPLDQPGAQAAALTISNATLRVSPEYDDPGVLVIFYGSFGTISKYPQQISLPLPAAARGVQATEQDPAGSLITRQWQRQGDQATYSLEEGPAFQYEFYLDRQPSGNDRVIDYTFHVPYAIASLTIMVQQPAGATSFTLTPKEDTTLQTGDGLTTYQINRANVAAGQDIALQMRYTRTSQAPSFAKAQTTGEQQAASGSTGAASNAAPAAAQAPASNNPPLLAMILIAVGAAALAGAAVYWFLEQRRNAAPAPAAGRGGRTGPAARSAGPAGASARRPAPAAGGAGAAASLGSGGDLPRFCRKCGREFAPADQFCGRCGTPRGD